MFTTISIRFRAAVMLHRFTLSILVYKLIYYIYIYFFLKFFFLTASKNDALDGLEEGRAVQCPLRQSGNGNWL